MTNYKQPHKFENSGLIHVSGDRECVCGFSEKFGDIHPVERDSDKTPPTDMTIEEIVAVKFIQEPV